MKTIYLATTNSGKVEAVNATLSPFGIKVMQISLDMSEPRSDDLTVIAKAKVMFAYNKIKKPCIAIDSGFYISALNDFPKAYVKFVLETIGVKGILKLVSGLKRNCEFRDCLAYYDGQMKDPKYFISPTKGRLLLKPVKGKRRSWGPLHKVFLADGAKKTFSQMTEKEWLEWKEKQGTEKFIDEFVHWFNEKK